MAFTIVMDASGNGTYTSMHTAAGQTFRFPINGLAILTPTKGFFFSSITQPINGTVFNISDTVTITIPANGAAGPKSLTFEQQFDRATPGNPCSQIYRATLTGS